MKTTPEVSFERVKKRNREGEVIPVEYLERCDNYHNMWLDNIDDSKKLIIDGNIDIESRPETVNIWTSTIHGWVISSIYKASKKNLFFERAPLNFIV